MHGDRRANNDGNSPRGGNVHDDHIVNHDHSTYLLNKPTSCPYCARARSFGGSGRSDRLTPR